MPESEYFNNAIFWVDVDRIKPNPFQPRRDFDEGKLRELASSIRQYGLIQPLTVSRKEIHKADGGLATEYELIAGERRLRASKIAGLPQVPVMIRAGFDDDKTKLELAIIENLQREDINAMDRAVAFNKLIKDFGFKAGEVASKVSKSREYVANTVRLLALPKEIQDALTEGKITEGHTRPLLMLTERPQEQNTLFREIMLKKITVRDAEAIARRIATDKVRKKEYMYAPEILQMERDLTEVLGTRVAIETRENGGKLSIDFMNEDDLRAIFTTLQMRLHAKISSPSIAKPQPPIENGLAETPVEEIRGPFREDGSALRSVVENNSASLPAMLLLAAPTNYSVEELDDRSREEKELDENSFDASNFSL